VKKQILFALFLCAFVLSPAFAQAPDKASAQLVTSTPHFHGGDEVSFKMKLNEPLPEGARFDVRVSPTGLTQDLTVSSQEATDKDRKEFMLKFKLPEHARGGEWHIATVYLFLPGASWTNSTIATNMTFVVDGPDSPLPTSATATIEKH
jgi:hypothetical protein